jgi:hypothetical protein
MKTRASRIVKRIEISSHQVLALETEFGTTMITIIPHISGHQRYTIEIEYVPYSLAEKERPLDLKRN